MFKPPLFVKGQSPSATPTEESTTLNVVRGKDYHFIKPLRLVDIEKESSELAPLKEKLQLFINEKVKEGSVSSASLYLRKLDDGSWISINGDTKYMAGSIHKITILIYYLKRSEIEPGILTKQVHLPKTIMQTTHETFTDKVIIAGMPYTIRELLERMIIYSDNDATRLLLMNLESAEAYQRVFTDLGLAKPDKNDNSYSLNADEISHFLRILYNCTYLKPETSEYALSLLSRTTFHEGITRSLPSTIQVAHKFGEAGTPEQPQFSELGIVYSPKVVYLISAMTKGTDVKKQAETVSQLSKIVFDNLQ